MKNRPFPVVIAFTLLVLAGCIGIAYHVKELCDANSNPGGTLWIIFLRMMAVVCGLFLFFRINVAQLLTAAWLISHIVKAALDPKSEVIAPIVFFAIISVLIFLPGSSGYFQTKN
jgi:hypothetical protein